MHAFLPRIGSGDEQIARAHIERVLRRSGGFVILGYTHRNEVRWARKLPDLPGWPHVQADNLGRLPRDVRVALTQRMQRAEVQPQGAAEAALYRTALLGRSEVVKAALVGRLHAHDVVQDVQGDGD